MSYASRRIFLTLIKCDGVRNAAAHELGISVATLRRRLANDKPLDKCWKIVADRFRKPEPVRRNGQARQPQYLALAGERDTMARYPDPASNALRDALAETYGLEAAQIVCGTGSDACLKAMPSGVVAW